MEKENTSRLTVCGLCDGGCFARVRVEDGRITRVSPVGKDDVVKSRLCVKGAALKTWVHAPERIEYPMRRVGEKGSGQFERISWEEAFALIAERLEQVKREDGAKATAFFAGHPKWLRYMLSELARDYGSPNYCTESSTCFNAPEIAYTLNYGFPYTVCKPDLKHCATAVVWGCDPAWSNCADDSAVFAVKERGGKLLVVDPRVTPVSERADIHLAIRPGTDGALALAMAHVMLKEALEDRAFLEEHALGLEEFRTVAAQMPPEKAAAICGISAQQIEAAARLYATGGPAAMVTSACGIAHSPNSVQNMRAVFLLQALSGNYGREGGNRSVAGWQLNGFHHAAKPRVNAEQELAQGRFPVWNELIGHEGQVSGLDLAILEHKPYRIRNLIAFGMNYRMFPRSDRMRRALLECEFFVDVDLYWSESAKCADLVLPCQVACERDSVHQLPGDRVLYLPRAIDPGEKRSDIEIIEGICAALGLDGPLTGMRTHDEYLDWMLEPSGVKLETLKALPDGVCACEPKHRKPPLLRTPSGKVEFRSTILEKYADLPGYDPLPVWRDYTHLNPDPERFPLLLSVGSRKAWIFHSRTFHLPWLSRLDSHPAAVLHPDDAQRLGIQNGERVRLSTPVGSMTLEVQVDAGNRRGVVGVLHDDDPSANDLVDAGFQDPISGFPGFKNYFCRVEREVQA